MKKFKDVEIIQFVCAHLYNAIIIRENRKNMIYTWGCNDDEAGRVLGRTGDEDEPQPIPELIDSDICKISIGQYHMVALDKFGKLYFWGTFKCDEFMGARFSQRRAIFVPSQYPELLDKQFIDIASGANFVVALTDDYRLIEWGWTDRSTEGQSNKRETLIPHDNSLPFGWRVVSIACGTVHAIVLAINQLYQQKIFSWGFNQQGQLGLGDRLVRHQPTPITTELPSNISQIAVGEFHNLILTEEGKVYSWGKNQMGQCGVIGDEDKLTPVEVSFPDLEPGEKIVRLGCGSFHSLAVTSKGRVYTWGDGVSYRRVNKNEFSSFTPEVLAYRPKDCVEAIAGTFHTAVITQSRD